MAALKVHFVPKKKFHKMVNKAICGKKWVDITYKTELVTCDRCKQSDAYKSAEQEQKDI